MSAAGERLTMLLQSVKGKRLVQELHDAAMSLRDILKAQLNRPGTGREYQRGGSPQYGAPDANGKRAKLPGVGIIVHRASRDGESPAPDTTNLRESASAFQTDASGLRWQVGVRAPGASALETGTSTAGRNRTTSIAARPYMAPAVKTWQATAGNHFTAARQS